MALDQARVGELERENAELAARVAKLERNVRAILRLYLLLEETD